MRESVFRAMAVASLALGALMVVGGTGHAWSVATKTVNQDREHDFRQASLFTVGWILIYTGALLVAFARGIWTGRRGAVLGGTLSATGFLGHFLLILPQQPGFWWGIPLFVAFIIMGVWVLTEKRAGPT